MKPLIESSGKRGLRINNKRKNFKTAKPPIEHEAGTIPDKTHPTNRGENRKPSNNKKRDIKNARQSENSSARLSLKKEIPTLTEEAKEESFEELSMKHGHVEYTEGEPFDDSKFSIGHKNLIDSPSYVRRKIKENSK